MYHVVTPGEPDENARCCLNGVRLDGTEAADVESGAAVEVEGRGVVVAGVRCTVVSVVGPLAGEECLGRLEPCVSN